MDKKDLKMYVTPETEVLDVEMESQLLDVSIEQPEWAPIHEDVE